jgi:hypothetical protein
VSDERTSWAIGNEGESRNQKAFGSRRQPQSGAGLFRKLDTIAGKVIFSIKRTEKADRLVITPAMIEEARDAASGPQGAGDDFIWAIEAQIGDYSVTIFNTSDVPTIARGEAFTPPDDKAADRISKAKKGSIW